MAAIQFNPPAGMEITYDQWNRMTAAQKQMWLKQSGYFDAVEQANARGDTVEWSLGPSSGSSANAPSKGSSGGSGAAGGLGGIAGTVAMKEGVKRGQEALFGGSKTETPGTPAPAGGDSPLPSSMNPSSASGGASPASNAAILQPVGSAANGGTIMSDGSTVMPNGDVKLTNGQTFNKDGVLVDNGGRQVSGAQDAMAGATVALAAWNAYQASKNKNLTDGQRNAIYAQSGASAVNAYNSSSLGAGNAWVGAAASAVGVGAGLYGNSNNHMMSNEEKAARGQQTIALGVADYFTGGLATPAATAFKNTGFGSKLDKKLTKLDMKYNPITKYAGKYGLFGQDKWATELQRMSKLNGGDVRIPQNLLENLPTKGRSLDEVLEIEKANQAAGKWSNVKFAESRDEADLLPGDIMGYAAFMEKYGNDWWEKYTPQQREQIAQAALDAKAVDEHHGTIDIKWSPELDAKVNEILVNKAQATNAQSGVGQTPSVVNKPAPVATGQQGSVIEAASGLTLPTRLDPGYVKPVEKMPVAPVRSQTKSPGIRLDGTLITDDPKKRAAQNRALMRY